MINTTTFEIKNFDLNSMVKNPSILIIGKRDTGKSFFIRNILHHYRNVPGGIVFSPTDKQRPFYKHFFPDLYIHHEIGRRTLQKVLFRQNLILQKAYKMKKEEIDFDPDAVVVMDDVLAGKKSWAKDESIMEILMNGRHYRLTYILTMQTPLGITPDLRLNFDYVFLLKEDSTINKKKLWDNYASMFPTLPAFEKVFAKCTEDYRAMVIDNRKPSDNLQEKVFWFKAQDRKFSFGSRTFKNLHKKYYDPLHIRRTVAARLGVGALMGRRKKNEVDIGVILK